MLFLRWANACPESEHDLKHHCPCTAMFDQGIPHLTHVFLLPDFFSVEEKLSNGKCLGEAVGERRNRSPREEGERAHARTHIHPCARAACACMHEGTPFRSHAPPLPPPHTHVSPTHPPTPTHNHRDKEGGEEEGGEGGSAHRSNTLGMAHLCGRATAFQNLSHDNLFSTGLAPNPHRKVKSHTRLLQHCLVPSHCEN